MGLCTGFLVWAYTLLIPAFAKSGMVSEQMLHAGPGGIGFLNPEQLFGLTGLDSLSHSVLWSMVFNVSLYVLGSLLFEQSPSEQRLADQFVDTFSEKDPIDRFRGQETRIDLAEKKRFIEKTLGRYFTRRQTGYALERAFNGAGIDGKNQISIWELADVYGLIEKHLAGVIGSAAAHAAMGKEKLYTHTEEKALSTVYGETLARLKITPEDMKEKIDYYEEREQLLNNHARELKQKIYEKELEIQQRRHAEKERLTLEVRLRQAQKM